VRLNAAVALGRHDPQRAIPFLRKSLSDPDQNIHAAAAEALEQLEQK